MALLSRPQRMPLVVAILATITGCSGTSRCWNPLRQSAAPHCTSTLPPSLALRVSPQPLPPITEPVVPPRPLTTVEKLKAAGPKWSTIGESVEERPIEATAIGTGPRRILFIGGIHGDEPEGLPVMEWFTEEMWNDASLTSGTTVVVVKNLNPDGTAGKTRGNKHGVDLNRNFPAKNWESTVKTPRFNPGPHPESEPETRVAVQLIREFEPHRILVMHATVGRPMNNYDGPAKALARRMSQFNKYAVTETIGYPTPGSLGNWAGNDLQIPIITLEFPRKVSPDRAWETNKIALRQMLAEGEDDEAQ